MQNANNKNQSNLNKYKAALEKVRKELKEKGELSEKIRTNNAISKEKLNQLRRLKIAAEKEQGINVNHSKNTYILPKNSNKFKNITTTKKNNTSQEKSNNQGNNNNQKKKNNNNNKGKNNNKVMNNNNKGMKNNNNNKGMNNQEYNNNNNQEYNDNNNQGYKNNNNQGYKNNNNNNNDQGNNNYYTSTSNFSGGSKQYLHKNGKVYINIVGVGERMIRYQKNGKRFVLVRGKKILF